MAAKELEVALTSKLSSSYRKQRKIRFPV